MLRKLAFAVVLASSLAAQSLPLESLMQSVSLGQFKKITPSTQKQPDNVMDWTLLFESR